MWKYVKLKIALILVKSLSYKKVAIDLKNSSQIFKNHHVKRISFQIHSKKIYTKNINIFLVIKFRRNFEFSLSNFIINYW